MTVMLFVITAVAACAPIFAAALVSVASRREDSGWTLGHHPARLLESAARQIVDFHCVGTGLPQPKSRLT